LFFSQCMRSSRLQIHLLGYCGLGSAPCGRQCREQAKI
jgi:hypothetical protein